MNSSTALAGSLTLIAIAALSMLADRTLPSLRDVEVFDGIQPRFMTESGGNGRFGSASLNFSRSGKIPCIFVGPRYGEVRSELSRAKSIVVRCVQGSDATIAIQIEADGREVLSYEEAERYWRRDELIGRVTKYGCLLGALLLAAIGFRKPRTLRSTKRKQ